MKIMVIGASGLLGKKILSIGRNEFDILGTFNSNKNSNDLIALDLSKPKSIEPVLDAEKPQAVIYVAGIVDEQFVEQYPRLSKLINADSAHTVAKWCEKNKSKMVYVSTDYVFDGESGPYSETSTPYPIQIYGFTKLLGEFMLQEHPSGAVLRVGILHGFNDYQDKPTDTRTMIQTLGKGNTITLDHYRIKYPYLIDDVAKYLLWIIRQDESGIFHVGGSDGVTRYEWGCLVAEVFGFDSSLIIPNSKIDLERLPHRPVEVKLLDTRVGFKICNLETSLRIIKQQMLDAK